MRSSPRSLTRAASRRQRSRRRARPPSILFTIGIAMATSSSATAPDGAPSSYRILESFGEQADAIDALLGRAQVSVRVFDTDLAQARWSSAARAQAVGDFLRRSRDARLQIIVHDTRHLESACARLVALLRRYSAAITIYR